MRPRYRLRKVRLVPKRLVFARQTWWEFRIFAAACLEAKPAQHTQQGMGRCVLFCCTAAKTIENRRQISTPDIEDEPVLHCRQKLARLQYIQPVAAQQAGLLASARCKLIEHHFHDACSAQLVQLPRKILQHIMQMRRTRALYALLHAPEKQRRRAAAPLVARHVRCNAAAPLLARHVRCNAAQRVLVSQHKQHSASPQVLFL